MASDPTFTSPAAAERNVAECVAWFGPTHPATERARRIAERRRAQARCQ